MTYAKVVIFPNIHKNVLSGGSAVCTPLLKGPFRQFCTFQGMNV